MQDFPILIAVRLSRLKPLPQNEIHGYGRHDVHRLPIQQHRLISPLLHSLNCGIIEQGMT